MRKRILATGMLLLLTVAVNAAVQNGNDLYQQGLARETAGDIKGAMQLFERIVRDFSSNRTLTAKALVQLGRWSDLLGQDQARKHYERVIREFADQKEAAAEARARLDVLAKVAGPGASPSRRLVADSRTINGMAEWPTRDGKHWLRYNEEQRAFELSEISTGTVRRLTTDGPAPAEAVVGVPKLSTDGSRLVAIVRIVKPGSLPGVPAEVRYSEQTELRVFEVGGRGPGRVLSSWDQQVLGGVFRPFAWSPANDRIWLFGTKQDRSAQIASVNMSGKLEVLKTLKWRDTGQFPSLSPDGKFVAFHDSIAAQNPSDLYIIATDGSSEHRVEYPSDDSKPMFLPDGSGVVFESNRRGERDLWFLSVKDGKTTGQPRLVWRDVGSFGSMDGFSDTGSLFFYFSGQDYGIYTVPINLNASTSSIGEATRIAPVNNESNSGAAFSPDGKYLAHFRGKTRLVLRDLVTGIEREIRLGMPLDRGTAGVDWCPSGDSLIAIGYVAGTGSVTLRINMKDASIERHSSIPNSYVPALCVGNGQDIIYLASTNNPWVFPGSVIRRSLVSGRETTLHNGVNVPLVRSRDGSRIAFVATDPKGGLRRSLVTMDADGGNVSMDLMPSGITSPPQVIFSAAWAPNGDRLLIAVRDADQSYDWTRMLQVPHSLWEVPLTGGAPRRLGVLPLPKVAGTYYGPVSLSMHPDGKQLAFQSHEGTVQQTWAIDNLFQFIKAGGGW
jgi:Tol biopolymer transport system component